MQTQPYPDVPPDFGHWLAGLIDGEGCFLILYQRSTHRKCYGVAFRVKLRSDDEPILRECHERTGLGTLAYEPRIDCEHGPKPQVRWQLQKLADAQRLVWLLERYPLRSKKRRDFIVWAEAVRVWSTAARGRRGHHNRNAAVWDRMAELKVHLSDGRKWREHDSVLIPEPMDANAVSSGDDLLLFEPGMGS